MNEELARHREAFLTEAQEHVQAMNAGLLRLERSPGDPHALHEVLRAAHTFKSMAATMGYTQLSNFCHALEDLLVAVREGTMPLTRCVDPLFRGFDFLAGGLRTIADGGNEPDSLLLIEMLRAVRDSSAAAVPIPVAEVAKPAPVVERIQSVAVTVTKLDTLLNLAEELLVAKMRLDRVKEALGHPELSAAVETLGRLISDVQYEVMQSRMVPIRYTFDRFPRMVRDLAKQQRKEIRLVTSGGDIELDRAMIDEVGECLVHLLRNAVDHGIETPAARTAAGKNAAGTLTLTASRSKETALISVADDGAGLDLEAIRRIGLARRLLTGDEPEAAVADLIFSGLSTAREVTAVSGRGVGLNAARRKIETIGGSLSVTSTARAGTRFVVEIPLTMAVIKALFIRVRNCTYALPVSSVDRLVLVAHDDVKGALHHEAIVLDRRDIPLVRLDVLFGHGARCQAQQPVVIVRRGEARVGLAVDKLLSTEELVIKPLNRTVRQNRYFAGSALIGSGEVILVLDVGHIMHARSLRPVGGPAAEGAEAAEYTPRPRKPLAVVGGVASAKERP